MIKVAVERDVSVAVRDTLLEIGAWQVGPPSEVSGTDFTSFATFANGDIANNKLLADLPLASYAEYEGLVPEARRVSPARLAEARELVTSEYRALLRSGDTMRTTLWGVPTGGQDYAIDRAERTELDVVRLAKVSTTAGKKTFQPATEEDVMLLAKAERMIASEDAGSEASSPFGAMFASDEHGLSALRRKTCRLDYIWVRGPLSYLSEHFLVHTVVHERIPVQVKKSDEFFKRFGHLAVQLQAPA